MKRKEIKKKNHQDSSTVTQEKRDQSPSLLIGGMKQMKRCFKTSSTDDSVQPLYRTREKNRKSEDS